MRTTATTTVSEVVTPPGSTAERTTVSTPAYAASALNSTSVSDTMAAVTPFPDCAVKARVSTA